MKASRLPAAFALAAALLLTACSGGTGPAPTETPSAVPLPTGTPAAPENPAGVDSEINIDAGGTDDDMSVELHAPDTPNAALQEKITAIYAAYPLAPMEVQSTFVDLTDADWCAYYTGLSDEQIAKVRAAVVSEPMTGSQAYSLVLVQVKDPSDAQEIADAMLDGIALDKWVCVFADRARAVTFGDTVLYVMADSELVDVDALTDAAANALDVTFEYEAEKTSAA